MKGFGVFVTISYFNSMKEKQIGFGYRVYDDISELDKEDAMLLMAARAVTTKAYAPYSKFHVGAAALMANAEVITGTNQENASYPVGICAERVLLGTVANAHPGVPVKCMAISYNSEEAKSDHPISPCGMCRQVMVEYEARVKEPIRLILGGMEGKVFVIESAGMLLPFAFTKSELG